MLVKLEIGEVTDRVSKQVGPGLLFENPIDRESGESYDIPVAINLMEQLEAVEPEESDFEDDEL